MLSFVRRSLEEAKVLSGVEVGDLELLPGGGSCV